MNGQCHICNKIPAALFKAVNPEKTAAEQVPGTARPANVEGFLIRGQRLERKQLWACVNSDQVKPGDPAVNTGRPRHLF